MMFNPLSYQLAYFSGYSIATYNVVGCSKMFPGADMNLIVVYIMDI